jgi:hypothetical protein
MGRKSISDLINKKAKNIQKIKDTTGNKTYMLEISDFLQKIEQIKADSGMNGYAFAYSVKSLVAILHGRLQTIDRGVSVEIKWNDFSERETWEEMYVDSVIVRWSEKFLKDNPDVPPEIYVDTFDVMLAEGD